MLLSIQSITMEHPELPCCEELFSCTNNLTNEHLADYLQNISCQGIIVLQLCHSNSILELLPIGSTCEANEKSLVLPPLITAPQPRSALEALYSYLSIPLPPTGAPFYTRNDYTKAFDREFQAVLFDSDSSNQLVAKSRQKKVLVLGEEKAGKSSFISMVATHAKLNNELNLIEYCKEAEYGKLAFGVMVMKIGSISASTRELYQQFAQRIPIVLFVSHCEFEDGKVWWECNKDLCARLGKSFH